MIFPKPSVLLWVWLGLLLLFAIAPGLDLWVAGQFFDPASASFPMDANPNLQMMRETMWLFFDLVTVIIMLMAAHSLASGRALKIPGRVWGYCVAFVLLGPWLLVNVGLKSHWGRARPAHLDIFGGEAHFTPPWQFASECASNCSFVSGEAAAAVTVMILLGVFLWNVVPLPWRKLLLVGLVTFAVVAASLRVMKGRHFLSDVLWAGVLMATLAEGLGRLFRIPAAMPSLTPAALVHDALALKNDVAESLGRRAGQVWAALRRARRLAALAMGRRVAEPVRSSSGGPEPVKQATETGS